MCLGCDEASGARPTRSGELLTQPYSHDSRQRTLDAGHEPRRVPDDAETRMRETPGVAFDYEAWFERDLRDLQAAGLYRTFATIERSTADPTTAIARCPGGAFEVVVWCSNDYLGLGRDARVVAAMQDAAARLGAGAGGTRNIAGTHPEVVELERDLARFIGKPAALVLSSGYAANVAGLKTLIARLPAPLVYSDADNHASIIDGVARTGAEIQIFRHNDIDDLERLLETRDPERPAIVVAESVYSMDGSFAPLADLARACRRHRALSFLDETHAVGLYGAHGAGRAEAEGLTGSFDVIQGGLGKGVGVVGGFLAGSSATIDLIRSHGRAFIFTTTLPPAVAAAARRSLELVAEGDELRRCLHDRADRLRAALAAAEVPFIGGSSQIVPVLVGEAPACTAVARDLLERHRIYVQPIAYPSVPLGAARLRLTPNPHHSDAQIAAVVDAVRSSLRVLAEAPAGAHP